MRPFETTNIEELIKAIDKLAAETPLGDIEFLGEIIHSEQATDYIDWCKEHGTDPSNESAEFYMEQTEIDGMERQTINDEDYGIWL